MSRYVTETIREMSLQSASISCQETSLQSYCGRLKGVTNAVDKGPQSCRQDILAHVETAPNLPICLVDSQEKIKIVETVSHILKYNTPNLISAGELGPLS